MNIDVFGDADDPQGDVEAIVALVAAVQEAQHNERVEDFLSLFSKADPVWTTGHGHRLSGWDTIHDFTAQVLPGASKHGTATYTPVRILFIRPDVAAVNVHQVPVDQGGKPTGDPEGRPFYILAKTAGLWKIAAAQNTQVYQARG
ncbi:SgcJ/EcaC family oxidoreductase [Nonomuraea diastatica]|uniref:SgcJ/EcaC family oxidoreductase n=1 Tax=Nonomuraea diastatica TaxID=1848329 RepID=A0A4R4WLH2_9ACTN|nr:SgcJ/EcaC family oxidoreductase [Nonomuraea diastatica]TDD14590.1 SgcJ/EcaC family oxidoreductase [Nonomuraea diastatica]